MVTVTAERDTVFKTSVLGSQELADFEKTVITAGQTLEITRWSPAINQHSQLELVEPLTALDGSTPLQTVYAYNPHITVSGPGIPQVIKLDVPYFTQLNNDTHLFGSGRRQCNTTSNAMLADFLLKGELTQQARARGLAEPESVYMELVRPHGDTISHHAQTMALRALGIESYFSTTLPFATLVDSLQAGIPVVIGVLFRTSGHVVLLVGQDPQRQIWYVHDPFGIRYGTSDNYDEGADGSYDIYTYDTLEALFDPRGTGGWGRIVTRVKGAGTRLS